LGQDRDSQRAALQERGRRRNRNGHASRPRAGSEGFFPKNSRCFIVAKGSINQAKRQVQAKLAHCHFFMAMVLCSGMKEKLVPIDRAGRIVLPKGVRQELAIKPGDTFKVSLQGSAVTLTPNKGTTGFVRKGQALVFSAGGEGVLSQETVNRLLAETSEERHESGFAGLRGPRGRA
jgi:AbrB family looped-hinge helix DNA binding protein